jgi:hypothetical protein
MQVTACTSFSIATSTEGMPKAATEIDFFVGQGQPRTGSTDLQIGVRISDSGHEIKQLARWSLSAKRDIAKSSRNFALSRKG